VERRLIEVAPDDGIILDDPLFRAYAASYEAERTRRAGRCGEPPAASPKRKAPPAAGEDRCGRRAARRGGGERTALAVSWWRG
jgi:hypothetical protein